MKFVLGIFPNLDKDSVTSVLSKVILQCHSYGIEPILPEAVAEQYNCQSYSLDDPRTMVSFDAAMSLGGDGTILRTSRFLAALDVPIFGVNLGKLGFLTEIEFSQLNDALAKLSNGNFWTEKRSMLQAEVVNETNNLLVKSHALNDIVLTKGHFSHLARLEIKIAGQKAVVYPADGIIVATATGSTAYSLAAGGPIVYPGIEATVLTPICAHSLEIRPLIIPMNDVVEMRVLPPCNEWYLAVDGLNIKRVNENERIFIRKSEVNTTFLHVLPPNYYETWQNKLRRGD
ncbi:MAG TPA: NAD(+)/NADH kinase [Candidatus Avacidaminococcus intestinavium]|uniref:NAD kinase n=1 Tax=Candidatus Avacidaminococcus intestinavium TaxID=2840684 RepID=A0A9D1MPF4_9FIRM|nr:NAD(+)/NADH kinase [Candidatus Avacidaminococcus intestinavium]